MIYNQFRPFERADGIQDGISTMLETGHDPMCGVDFIAMPKLGPSLENLIELIPGGRLTPRMVVAVAFQLVSATLHRCRTAKRKGFESRLVLVPFEH